MATRSREFVGIAEGIKSHELSTKGKIEQLKGRISELSGQKRSLNGTISYLESAIAAAYEDTDEDGDPDYALIASLESQKASAENDLSSVEQDLDVTGGELSHSESELEGVLEEKAQTLFEIQERARKTSNNIALAGGMYGAYAGVGGSLQSSMQTSLSSLSQAAGILGGSIDTTGGGSSGGSSSSSSSAANGTTHSDISTSPLAAFSNGGSSGGVSSSVPTASKFSSTQTGRSTPGTMPNFHSGQKTINAQKPLNFNSEQASNSYAISGFVDSHSNDVGDRLHSFVSEQKSSNVNSNFNTREKSNGNISQAVNGNEVYFDDGGIGSLFGIRKDKSDSKSFTRQEDSTERSDLKKKRAWSEQYKVSVAKTTPSPSSKKSSTTSSSTAIGQLQKQLAHETGMEIDDGIASLLLSSIIKRDSIISHNLPNSDSPIKRLDLEKKREWAKQYEVDVEPIEISKSSTATINDTYSKGQKEREKAYTTSAERDDGLISVLSAISALRNDSTKHLTQDTKAESVQVRNQQLVGKIDKIVAQNGWKPKQQHFSLEEDLKAVNPQFYDSNNKVTSDGRWTRNCQRCVIALEARFRGADVQAKARVLDGTDTLPMMKDPNGWPSVFQNPILKCCKGSNGIITGVNVVNEMKKYGNGSRAIVRIQRCNTIKVKTSTGHIENYAVETVDGRTVVCDIITRKEIDISSNFPSNDFSDGVELRLYKNPFDSSVNETVLVTKKDGKRICIAQNHGGHVFSAIQQDGKTIFCDAQTGKIIEKPENYFYLAKREETYVVRIDNLEFTERAKDCCQ